MMLIERKRSRLPRKLEESFSRVEIFRAKKFVVDLLLSECKGATVPELLATNATDNSEKLHDEKYNQEKMWGFL